MATASNQSPRRMDDHKIVLEPGISQVFALKQPRNGKEVGQYGSVMYTAVDDRKLFVVQDEASDFHHAMVTLGIQPAEFIRVTRIKHGGRGGGFEIRVERVQDESESDPRLVGQLEKSIEMARARTAAPSAQRRTIVTAGGAPTRPLTWDEAKALGLDEETDTAPIRSPGRLDEETDTAPIRSPGPAPATARAPEHQERKDGVQPAVSELQRDVHQSNGNADSIRITPVTAKFMAAYMAAIDTLIEARTYAQRKGLALEIHCEDVRCLAATFVIDQKGGR